jgi:hypothetical protein
MDVRVQVANQIGSLVLLNVELNAMVQAQEDRIKALEVENAKLKETQSEGKATAVAHLSGGGDVSVFALSPDEASPATPAH